MQDLPVKDESVTVHSVCGLFTEQWFNFMLIISKVFLEGFIVNAMKYS